VYFGGVKKSIFYVLICTCLCKLLVRCIKLFLLQTCEIFTILYSRWSRHVIIYVLKDCTILSQDLFYRVFVEVYRGCQVRIANCCYEISNMLFLAIMSLCSVCVCVCVALGLTNSAL